MSLKAFHWVFILASISLSIFVAYWALMQAQETRNSAYALFAIASILFTAGLIFYLSKFISKMKAVRDAA